MNIISVFNYATLILLGLIVLSAFAIADVLKNSGYVKSRLYAFDPLPYIEGSKKMYHDGDKKMRFWVKVFFLSIVILMPLSLLELVLELLVK